MKFHVFTSGSEKAAFGKLHACELHKSLKKFNN
jgi:hypothetical protein